MSVNAKCLAQASFDAGCQGIDIAAFSQLDQVCLASLKQSLVLFCNIDQFLEIRLGLGEHFLKRFCPSLSKGNRVAPFGRLQL